MTGVSASQTLIPMDMIQVQEKDNITIDNSQAMWNYKNLNILGQYPVDKEAQNLPLDSIQKIQKALTLTTKVVSWTGYISPAQQDKPYLEQYDKIQQGLVEGRLRLIDQQKHFCSSIGKLMVFVTFGQMLYKLNPRYNYLKGQINVVSTNKNS